MTNDVELNRHVLPHKLLITRKFILQINVPSSRVNDGGLQELDAEFGFHRY